MVKIKEIPINDRPRERLVNIGSASLSNEELLAIILKTGIKDKSAKELANLVLKKAEDICNLKNITLEELLKISGIGLSKATTILSMIELSKRMNNNFAIIKDTKFSSSKLVFDYFKNKLDNINQEHFYCIYLDNKKKIIKEKLLYIGTINQTLIHPRDIFKEAYLISASAIICVHNHPSGNTFPSKEDIIMTKNLKEIGLIMGIGIIDHIIISKNSYYSFFENGDI